MANEMQKTTPFGMRDKVGYMFGDFANDFTFILSSSFLMKFYTDVMGVSAGSMNAARIVYAAPEEPGEAADPHYSRWLNGLGLTETRILPHYQFIREHVLDGQKVEDIALADSKKRHFLALPDGSYILCADGSEALYGKAWYFADGMMDEINEDEDVLPLR